MKLILILFVCIALVSGRKTWRQRNKKSDSEIEKCMHDKVQTIISKLQDEPFKMDRIHADTSMIGVKMKATIRNVVTYGGSKLRIDRFKVISHYNNKYISEVKVVIPHLDVTADYYFKGTKLFFIDFETHGKFKGKFYNVEVVFKYSISSYIKRGLDYLRMDDVKTKVSIGSGRLDLKQADRSPTGREIASYARSNPVSALKMLTSAIEKDAAHNVKNYVNDLMAKVPLKVYAC